MAERADDRQSRPVARLLNPAAAHAGTPRDRDRRLPNAGCSATAWGADLQRRCVARVVALCARVRASVGCALARAAFAIERVGKQRSGTHRVGDQAGLVNVPTFEEAAEAAREEWARAMSYFDQVVDPDLIDYAAYSLRAAERKYVYLLKKAREESALTAHTSAR